MGDGKTCRQMPSKISGLGTIIFEGKTSLTYFERLKN